MAEEKFNPQKELQSFSTQFAFMRREIAQKVKEMRKTIGGGLIDTKEVKKNLEQMDKYVQESAGRFGSKFSKVFETISKNFKASIESSLVKISKENINASFANFGKQIEEVANEARSKIGTESFDEEFLKEISDKYKEISDSMESIIDQGKIDGVLKTRALNNIKKQKQGLDEIIKLKQEELNKTLTINNQILAVRKSIEDISNNALDFITKIPGGNYFAEALGLEKIKEQIKENVGVALASSLEKGVDVAAGFRVAMQGVASAYMQFAKMLLINPWTIALVGIALLIKKAIDLENAAEDFRHTTGLTIDQTTVLRREVENTALSMRKYGLSLEDAFAITGELYSQFKNILFISPNLVKTVALLKENLAVSDSTGAKIVKSFLSMDGVSKSNLNSWIATTGQLAEANGIAPVDVFNDIAENSELIGKYFKGNVKEVIATSVAARKLGLELSDVGSIIDNVMDFESSISKELEASMLLGKSINFNKARYLAFNGEIEQATNEVVRQLGSLEEFNKLNYIQKQALADVTGLSISKIQESLQTQKFINELEREGKLTEADKLMLKAKSGELTKEEWLNQKRIHSTVSNLKNSFAAIGASLSRIILPVIHALMPAVEVIAKGIGKASDFINNILDGMNEIIPGSKEVSKNIASWSLLFFAARKPLTGLVGILTKMGGGLFGKMLPKKTPTIKTTPTISEKAGNGLGTFFDSFKKVDIKSIGKFALISGILIASLIGLAFALKQFEGVEWENLGMAGAALAGLTLIATIMSKLPVQDMLIGSAAIVLLGASLIPLTYAMSLMEKVTWEKLGIAAAALVGFSLAAFALGAIMFTGVGALLFGAGILSIIALGGAMVILGEGVQKVSEAFKSNSLIDDIKKLAESAPQLMATSAAIIALTGALSAFALANVGAGLFGSISDLLGTSMIDQIERISEAGPGVQQVAQGLKTLRGGIENAEISSISTPDQIEIPAEISGINSAILDSNDKITKKLDDVIKAIRDINLYIDGKKLNENLAKNTSVNKLT